MSIINMKPMETDAIIAVAPCRECLDIYNYLKQVNWNENNKYLAYFHISLSHRIESDLKDER